MRDTQLRLRPAHRSLIALVFASALLSLLLAGCALLNPLPPDPLAEYRLALRPEFTMTPAQVDALVRYSITLRVDPARRAYTGTEDVSIPITGSLATNEFYFRLYPNLRQFDGDLKIASAHVNGAAINFTYEADGTAVRVVMTQRLEPGSVARVRFGFSGKLPAHRANHYTIFGTSEDITTLSGFYPILAGRRSNSAGADAWALDIADPQGDVGFHDAALYRVRATLPVTQVIAATGAAVRAVPADPGWMTVDYVQGPSREFTLVMSPDLLVEQVEVRGISVLSYFLPQHADAGRSALYTAAASLAIYEDVFGPYPYREMAVVEAPLTYHGMEFPGLNLIGMATYDQYVQDLETRVAHEVAHQWWYNQVGSDQTLTPWLDEGLTEFSMYYYYSLRYGTPVGSGLRRSRWALPVDIAKGNGTDAPIGLAVGDYKGNYEIMVYAKGALFFAALRDELGPEPFDRMLRTYLKRYAWRIASVEEFQALAEETAGRDLNAFFRSWVDGVD